MPKGHHAYDPTTFPATTHGDIDLSAREFWAKPPAERDAAFAVLRRENPVAWSRPADSDLLPPELNLKGFWSLTKHEDIRLASRHTEVFSSAQGITMEDFPPGMIPMCAVVHRDGRAAAHPAARDHPGRVQAAQHAPAAGLDPGPRPRPDHARCRICGEGDFVELVSVKLPGRIFGSFFGLPEGEIHEKTINAAQRLLGWTDPEVCGDKSALELFAGAVMDLHETARS